MRVGGTERLTVSMANELLRQGNECGIFVIWNRHRESLVHLDKKIPIFLGGRSHKFDFSYLAKLRRIQKNFRPDVILCEANFAYLSVKLAGIINSSAVFLVIHYTHNFTQKDEIFDRLFFHYLKFSSDKVIAIYEKQIDHFSIKHKMDKERFVMIHNGVDTDYFKTGYYGDVPHSVSNASFNIVHVANYREEKDQWTLLEAVSKFDKEYENWQLMFCGNIPEKVKNRFIRFTNENKINGKVIFLNRVTDVREILRYADSFVLSSISEALPISALEAMAMEVPCILTDVGGCSDIIDDGVNGFLVPPRNPDAVVQRLLFLAQHSPEAEEMGKEARITAIRKFGLKKMAEKYSQLFRYETH